MKTLYLFFPLFLTTILVSAQTTLTGRVTDQKGHTLPGANVFIQGSYDGANTDSTGRFQFTTDYTFEESQSECQ